MALAASLWRSFATPEHDLRDHADKLTAPTQILWGKRDRALAPSVGRATHKRLAHSKLEVLDTGHVVFLSDPEGFLRVVNPFLASLPTDKHRHADSCSRPTAGPARSQAR